ncbi:sulfurtransferase [Thiorhodococcus minor]|uniref:Sulfurtransferase n=1 Tax=Thiorhodococcus minor TaxID=57489 RepID=A0A6M0K487_9GAMM|nr:rhodanese-like domain-containing protein [Thiorhodococcus minor]NEV64602.1 sulfurtransferase [Thiorhodococcus minor]
MIQSLRFLLLIAAFGAAPAYAAPAYLVDADWLAEHIEDGDLVVLEVRYHPHRYLTVGHIPGAVQVQRFKDLGDNTANPLMRFPSKDAFQGTLRRWGINDGSTLVLYDDARTALASRLYFLLALYGFPMEQVKVLNGGTVEWTAFNELSQEPVARAPGDVTLKEADTDLLAEWTDVYDDVVSRRDPDVILLDARPHDMYTGAVIRHSIAGGHIPGAVNVVSLDGTDAQAQTWLGDEALTALYREIPKGKTLYVYCHDGFRMSLAWMQLRHLGYTDVRLYNGGWSHWGNTLTLPIVEGEKPLDGDFAL